MVLGGVRIGTAFTPSSHQPLLLTGLATAVAVAAGLVRQRQHSSRTPRAVAAPADASESAA